MTVQIQPQLPLQRSERASTKGCTEPRLFTPPLCELTPETSYGFAVISFARDVLKQPLTPWQEWAVIHLGELLEDGRPRFRKILILVARQNGKTHLLKVLAAFWMTVARVEQILGLSTTATAAREAWNKTRELIESNSILMPFLAHVRTANDDPHMRTAEGSIYRTKAANREASRGLTVDRIIFDELREQKSFEAWDAVLPTMAARPGAQAIAISNAGDDRSIVLNTLQASAVEFISSAVGDYRLGLFEWSAAPGDDITDPQTWAKANPNMGYVFSEDELRGDAIEAVNQGGEVLTGFKTERLCMRVSALDAAVDADKWKACYVDSLDWTGLARRSALFLDIAGNSKRATLVAAYTRKDGKTQVGILREWRDENAMSRLEADLEAILKKDKPRAFGWMPIGPAAAKATLKNLNVPGVAIEQYTGEVADACMTFADLVRDAMIVHSSDTNDLLSQQVTSAAKKHQGDRWKFDRKGGNYDAALAAAGAVLLARSLPPKKTARLIGPDDGQEDE
jgi:hypothetical protein